MESSHLELEASKAIKAHLKKWEVDYFQQRSDHSKDPKWIYFTTHKVTSVDPPKSTHVTTFSQPTAIKPIPRATASVTFEYSPEAGLQYQFETNRLKYNSALANALGNPIKRLKEIVKSKEDTAEYFLKFNK